MKTVPSVEYTVIKTVDIESEPGFGRGRDFFKIARARAVERLVIAGGLKACWNDARRDEMMMFFGGWILGGM